jgi:hypothetical protein
MEVRMKTYLDVGPTTGVVGALVNGDDRNDRLGLFAELIAALANLARPRRRRRV